jgi:hypothetical protein
MEIRASNPSYGNNALLKKVDISNAGSNYGSP